MKESGMGSTSFYVNVYAVKKLKDAGFNVSAQVNRYLETLSLAEDRDPYLIRLEAAISTERDLRVRADVMIKQAEKMLAHANALKGEIEELKQERIVMLAAQKRRELIWHMNIIIKNADYNTQIAWTLTEEVRNKLEKQGRKMEYDDFAMHVHRLLSVAD